MGLSFCRVHLHPYVPPPCSLRVCLVDADKGVRCQVLRLIRYFLADDDAHRKSAALAAGSMGHTAAAVPNTLSLACELERYNFGVFLSRSLERDGKHMWERMHVYTNQHSIACVCTNTNTHLKFFLRACSKG